MFGGVFPPVVAHLMADTGQFVAKMAEADALVKSVTRSAGASWQSAGKQAMGVGGAMAVAAGAVAFETLKMASAFDAQMERVHTQANASQAEVDSLKQSVLNLAMATGQGPEKLAEALYHVESVGYRGKVAMEVLTNAAKLATISGANLDDTTYGLTSVMQTFGAKAGDAAKYAALFNATVGAGDMRMESFNRAVGTGFYSTAETFKISAQSASAALAFMTDRGAHADEAATRLRMTIALMAAPSLKATNILHSLGLTATDTARSHEKINGVLKTSHITYSELATDLMKPDGFYVALKHLQKGLENSGLSAQAANAQLSHAFGGGKSDSTILAMLNNLDTLKSKYVAVGKGMGSYAESYKAATNTAQVQTERFKATMQVLGIEIGHDLMPYALKFMNWLRDIAAWMATHEGAVKFLAFLIGVTLVAGFVLATAGAIAFAAATIEIWGPIALIILGIMALVAAVVFLWTHWHQIWGWIVDHARMAGQAIGRWVASMVVIVVGWFRTLMTMARGIWNMWYSVTVQPVIDAVNAISHWVSNLYHWVMTWLVNTINSVRGLWGDWVNIGENIVQGIISGIQNMASAAWNQVTSFASGLWQGMKSILGIASPSKVFADEVGKWIPAGVAVGVAAHTYLAEGSVASMADKLRVAGQVALAPSLQMSGMTTAASFAISAAASAPQPVIHVHTHVTAEVDKQVLFRTTQTESLKYDQRNGAPAFQK